MRSCFPFPQLVVTLYPHSHCATFWGPLGHVLPKLSWPSKTLLRHLNEQPPPVMQFRRKPSQFCSFSLSNPCPFLMYLQCKEVSLFMAWLLTSLLSLALLLLETGPRFRRAVASVCWKLLAMGFSNTPFVGLAQHILNATRRVCLLIAGKGSGRWQVFVKHCKCLSSFQTSPELPPATTTLRLVSYI